MLIVCLNYLFYASCIVEEYFIAPLITHASLSMYEIKIDGL